MGNESSVSVRGRGNVEVSLFVNGRATFYMPQSVLYVSELSYTLFSVVPIDEIEVKT